MSAFTGRQGKGAARRHRETKRAEAVARQSLVVHERTKTHRLKCDDGACNLLGKIFRSPR